MGIRSSWLLAGALIALLIPADRIAAQTAGDAAKSETATTLVTLGTRGGPLPMASKIAK